MRGQKAYNAAHKLYSKLYEYPSKIGPATQRKIYYDFLKLIRKSAYQGYPEALYELGQQYEDMSFLGMENPMYNPKKRIYWYMKACKMGHAEAFNNLGHMFYHGDDGCKKDLKKALRFYKTAAALGSRNGKKNYRLALRSVSALDKNIETLYPK